MKEYTVRTISNSNHQHEYTGTLDYLIDNVFGYTLECNGMGISFKRPKTIKTLLDRLNGGDSFWSRRTSYELVK